MRIAKGPDWPVLPSLLRVWVPDADRAFERAVAAGATVVTELDDSAFGQRGGRDAELSGRGHGRSSAPVRT
ncbi:VOC family protein [Cellulomonas dongxiuzhuiae]|uniref:VOC family protein n=1 Tax=Cellulomonas dongxiuzhuiae TaxID=2819979 RepID=UPI001FBA3967|nr:hypothetical protein [Cellulomonas dongxiuzhuiae]